VSDLFSSDYADVLNEYRLAKAAAAEIRPSLQAGDSMEDVLRERLRDSSITPLSVRFVEFGCTPSLPMSPQRLSKDRQATTAPLPP